MSDTDYSKWANEKIDEAVARDVMGWHAEAGSWRNADGTHVVIDAGVLERSRWAPTVNPAHSAHLLRHLCESGRFEQIVRGVSKGGAVEVSMWAVDETNRKRLWGSRTLYATDRYGFIALCLAALRAYRAEQEAEA